MVKHRTSGFIVWLIFINGIKKVGPEMTVSILKCWLSSGWGGGEGLVLRVWPSQRHVPELKPLSLCCILSWGLSLCEWVLVHVGLWDHTLWRGKNDTRTENFTFPDWATQIFYGDSKRENTSERKSWNTMWWIYKITMENTKTIQVVQNPVKLLTTYWAYGDNEL